MAVNQAYLFLIFTLNGIFIGLVFDFFRILRQGFKTNNVITYVEDIIFWIISGLSVIYSMVNFCNGDLRFFMVIGLVIGFITYILTVSRYIRKCSISIINFLKKIVKFICSIFIYPLKIIYNIIINPLKIIYINIIKKNLFSSKNIKNHLNEPKISKNNKKSKIKRGIFLKKVEK